MEIVKRGAVAGRERVVGVCTKCGTVIRGTADECRLTENTYADRGRLASPCLLCDNPAVTFRFGDVPTPVREWPRGRVPVW